LQGSRDSGRGGPEPAGIGPGDLGFAFGTRKNGDVVIRRGGRSVAVLRKQAAARFLHRISSGDDPQQLMARVTGNYRRGNERA